MYFVYVLKSLKDKKYYYGLTSNIERREKEHNDGFVTATKSRRPLQLIYFETANTLKEARQRERYFKSGFGRKYIANKIKNMALSSIG